MVHGIRAHLLLLLAIGACGGKPTEAKPERRDAGTPPDAPALELAGRPLGLPDLTAYAWRKRGGHPAFRMARKAEAANDWATVVTTCRQALAADPGHLEAAYLLAAGLGKLGKHDELLEPLQHAAAGDFGKWGPASLDLAELQPFLATPLGDAWKRRVERDRAIYIEVLGRSLIVEASGDLFAYDVDHPRWYRVTRTFGAVIGALRVTPTKIAYVTRQRGKDKRATLAIGLVDLARGKTSRAAELGTKGPIVVAYSATPPTAGVWIGVGGAGGRPQEWWRFDDDFKLTQIAGKQTRPRGPSIALDPRGPSIALDPRGPSIALDPRGRSIALEPRGPWLEAKGKSAVLHALPIPDVSADFDDKGFASAARIGKSNRIVTVPAPAVIAGNTATWSPDRARLAFVAQLDDRCAPGAVNAAAFVVDATTGQISGELEKAAEGLAVEWVSERRLAIAGDKGVSIIDLDRLDAAPTVLAGAHGLVPPRHRPTCTPPDADDLPPEDPADTAGAAKEASGAGSGAVKLVEPPPKTLKN